MSFRGAAMDHNQRRSVHQRSSKVDVTKRRDVKKKKQVKVVYISNPVYFKASASEFKGLVQQFTGLESDVDELSKFAGGCGADWASFSADDDSASLSRPAAGDALQQQQQQQQQQRQAEPYKWAGVPALPYDAFDEVVTEQDLEKFAAFMPT